MLDHHLQRSIVYRLALSESLRFSELKPDDIESKLFTYHLQKTTGSGLVKKQTDGRYALTAKGKRLGVHVLQNAQALVDRAYSVLFLVIRRQSDGAWLLYKRQNHPLRDRIGFMHATPNAYEPAIETARQQCLQRTGLDCSFSVRGSGYFRVFRGSELESFTHFSLLVCENARGKLRQQDELATYIWVDRIDSSDKRLLPNMPLLLDRYNDQNYFFIDETISL